MQRDNDFLSMHSMFLGESSLRYYKNFSFRAMPRFFVFFCCTRLRFFRYSRMFPLCALLVSFVYCIKYAFIQDWIQHIALTYADSRLFLKRYYNVIWGRETLQDKCVIEIEAKKCGERVNENENGREKERMIEL